MRLLILLALVAVVAVALVLVYYAVTGGSRPAVDGAAARWETHTESRGGVTTVLVRRIDPGGAELGRQVIATIQDGDPDWESRYHEAMAQARSRVATLEIESD